MITNPSEKDEIYLKNVEKIGKSVDSLKYIENFLPEEDHKTLLEYVRSQKEWAVQPWDSQTIGLDKMPENIVSILEEMSVRVHKEMTDLYDVEINPFDRNNLVLIKFEKGLALYPHVDTDSAESNHLASIYYINDDYIGGEICFPDLKVYIKPTPNSLIFFPGNENYLHEVRTILTGDRFSSSMWFQFTGSTFTQKSEWYN
jgi:hypothetical protein